MEVWNELKCTGNIVMLRKWGKWRHGDTAKYKSKKKVLVIDLDNTIWGGILGDDGYKNLRIGGHDEVGEAFLDFQKKIKSYFCFG